jgi:outer membrane protein assembly factor BamC
MNRHIISLSLLSLTLSACSGVSDNKRATGDLSYQDKNEASNIKVPTGLSSPKLNKKYFISKDINHQGPIGANVDVRAPSLVLPVAASSRVELDSNVAKIWFDQVLDDSDLTSFIYNALNAKLNSDNNQLKTIDKKEHIYESDWYNTEIESDSWLSEKSEIVESMRFRYQLEVKPHGRSVGLLVSLVDYKKPNSDAAMNLIDQERAEMAMINEIIAQVDYQYRLKKQENRLLRANKKLVSMTKDEQGQSVYLVDMELDAVWANMPIFFENHGFTINDLNETQKVYFVDFIKPESSFWNNIWGDSLPELMLENGKYQFMLKEQDDQTQLSLLDNDKAVLNNKIITEIFPVIAAGLSFGK